MTQRYKNWTDDEDERLLAMRAAGKRSVVIAKVLGRTESAVVSRIGILMARARLKPQTAD